MILEGLEGAGNELEGLEDSGDELEGLEDAGGDLDGLEDADNELKALEDAGEDPWVLQMLAMIEMLLSFLPQPRHNLNILWKRILLRHYQIVHFNNSLQKVWPA